MIELDVVYAKVGNIHNCLRRIRQGTELDPHKLEDIDVQDIFVLNLQRAVQSAIDLAAHVIAAENLGLPTSLKENFVLLQQNAILSTELSNHMIAMVGFRNIAVHDYQSLDLDILKSILEHNLVDLEDYTRQILKYYQL